jgi:hypothetical protein
LRDNIRALLAFVFFSGGPLVGCNSLAQVYPVVQTPVDSCEIRTNGEFCDDPSELPAPTTQTYAVEYWTGRSDDPEAARGYTAVYSGDETWVADGTSGERVVVKREVTLRNGCESTTERTLTFDEDLVTFTGSFERRDRVEGPPSCGDTPFGTRQFFSLAGERSQSL